MKNIITLFLLTLFFTAGFSQTNKTNDMIKELYYMIDFRASACAFDILINDVSALTMDINGQIGASAPINFLILESGQQQLEIIVRPNVGETQFDENVNFSAVIKLYDVSERFILIEEGLTFEMNDEDKTKPICSYKSNFNAEVPYKLDAWQKSVNLDTVESLREKVELAYKRLADIIAKGEYDTLRDILEEREKNMAISMYLDEESSEKRLDGLIEDFENGYEIEPLSGTEIMYLYANSKLVCLKTPEGDSALRLRHKETNEMMTVEVVFHLKHGEIELSVI